MSAVRTLNNGRSCTDISFASLHLLPEQRWLVIHDPDLRLPP